MRCGSRTDGQRVGVWRTGPRRRRRLAPNSRPYPRIGRASSNRPGVENRPKLSTDLRNRCRQQPYCPSLAPLSPDAASFTSRSILSGHIKQTSPCFFVRLSLSPGTELCGLFAVMRDSFDGSHRFSGCLNQCARSRRRVREVSRLSDTSTYTTPRN